ncbi:MAG: NADH-quinone oxidoreductase subunit C [Oscillospiraceae bacterium]|nr:NADH-quinone oxidoreductase subunit C [Oscillospiraceae bacterium]
MQEYKKIAITKDDVIPTAKKMREEGIALAMIHGFLNDEGKPNISYEYEVGSGIESYTVDGEESLPSIAEIYDLAAEWPEREIMELMEVTFEGLDTSKRLFMPDTMLDGQGQILVTPMDDLIKRTQGKKGE